VTRAAIRVDDLVARIREGIEEAEREAHARRRILEHRGGLRGFPTLRVADELARLNRGWILDPKTDIRSHRPIVGRAIAGFKTRVQRLVIGVLEGYLVREREFLADLVRFLNRISERLDVLARTAHADDELLVGRTEVVLQHAQEDGRALELEVERLRREVSALRRAVGASGVAAVAPAAPSPVAALRPLAAGSDADRLRAYVPALVEHAPVFHVPAGDGELLARLRETGVEGAGIEPDADLAARARERGFDVREGPPSLSGVTGRGAIVITDGERFSRGALAALVRQASSSVRPQGVVLVETPNPDSWAGLARLARSGAVGEGVAAAELIRICEDAGLEDVRADVTALAPPPLELPAAEPRSPTLTAYAENFRRLNRILFAPSHQYAIGRRP
jgi:hypothetical protein